MKMHAVKADVFTGGLQDAGSFKFEMNAMAFRSVIDGIYADKIRAPVREYCTNAFDAHRMAGKADKPFDVQLPSRFEPIFRVRDYGVGLDHDEVMNLYSTMFASSKRETNDAVGMIGLGSKSAFAYTSSFTVTCWDGRERRTYSAFLGDEGVPQMALLDRQASIEPKGVEISFPVKNDDISAFHTAAKRVFLGFDLKPNVVNETFRMDDGQVQYQGTGWRMFGPSVISQLHARQGCVIYPIDGYSIGEPNHHLLRHPIVIDFPIGKLSVATSREQLGYDADTIANIKKRLVVVEKELAAECQKEIDACPTFLEACILADANQGYYSDKRALWSLVFQSLRWNGKPLVRNVLVDPMKFTTRFHYINEDTCAKPPANFGFRERRGNWRTYDLNTLKHVTFILEPQDTKFGTARMKKWLATEWKQGGVVWIKEEADVAQVLSAFLSPTTIDLSTVDPDLKKPAKGQARKDPTYVLKVLPSKNFVPVKAAEGGVYVQREEDRFKIGTQYLSESYIQSYVNDAIRAGVLPPDFRLVVLTKQYDRVPTRFDGWVSFEDHLKEKLKAVFDPATHTLKEQIGQIRSDRAFQMLANDNVKLPSDLKDLVLAVTMQPDTKTTYEH
ncbi:hypothetical protein ACUN0C_18795, partial [Faunimonas sp. B44]|uniref:hypothetical protein n=1 Tax=Faunimonas sp. B44 TaxID=3461493 RepID=UPI00404455C9